MCRIALLTIAIVAFGGMVLWSQPNAMPPGADQATHSAQAEGAPAPAMTPGSKPPVDPPSVKPDGSLHIDPNQLELRHEKGRWVLRSAGVWIKDFGGDALAARTGYQIIRQLHLTELVWVGKVQPTLEFFLRGDKPPPTPVGTGLQVVTFHPEMVEPRSFDGMWWLAEKGKPLLHFGESREDAEKALALIHQYQVNQIACIERPPLSMVLLAVSPNQGPQRKANLETAPKKPPMHEPSLTFPAREKKADALTAFNRLTFAYGQVQLRQSGSHWQMAVGRAVLKDFGLQERLARDALKALQYYRFTEQYRFDGEEESFEFYLAAGQAPRGHMLGISGITFNPKDLVVRQDDDQSWVIRQELQPLVRFKTKEHAEQALEIIRRFRFDHLYRLGEPEPLMIYFTQAL